MGEKYFTLTPALSLRERGFVRGVTPILTFPHQGGRDCPTAPPLDSCLRRNDGWIGWGKGLSCPAPLLDSCLRRNDERKLVLLAFAGG